jgi:signal transduction histidine kinase/CheY-like chemotaxis protein
MSTTDRAWHRKDTLRAGLGPVVAALAVVGVVLFALSDLAGDVDSRVSWLLTSLLLLAGLGVGALVAQRLSDVGRWFIVVVVGAAVWVGVVWLESPGFIALLAVPVAVASVLVGTSAALVMTLAQSVLIIALPLPFAQADALVVKVLSGLSPWVVLSLTAARCIPLKDLAQRSWEHYERARDLADQAGEQRMEMEQTLDDLAHANRQLALTNERLADLRLIAEEAQKAKAAFLAKVSHEFRTPLNMIIGLADLIVETPQVYGEDLPPRLLEHLEIVTRNCRHLSRMVDDVLDLSQIDAGRMALHREWVDLGQITENALSLVRPLTSRKGIALSVSVPEDLRDVYCDRVRIAQVIVNLLTNAARFTDSGEIRVSAVQSDGHVTIGVRDTGPGICEEDAARIFEPFCQGTGERRPETGGSGLGLTISKQFVELHGGRMWLETEVGRGSEFLFQLPVQPADGPSASPGRWLVQDWEWRQRTQATSAAPPEPRRRVVVCDPTGEVHSSFVRHGDDGEYVGTASVRQALSALGECPARAVIVNGEWPGSVWESIHELAAAHPDTPMVGCSVPPRDVKARQAGARDYLVKPITRAKLAGAISRIGRRVARVLIVDDDEDARNLLVALLTSLDDGLAIWTAANGHEALDAMRERRPDLVLLDVLMPEVDGWEVMARKAEDDQISSIPVLLVSAQDPNDEPHVSCGIVATMGEGVSLGKLLRCTQELAAVMLEPG